MPPSCCPRSSRRTTSRDRARRDRRGDVADRVDRLSDRFAELAPDHDVIHTHDWFGYGPGRQAARASDATWVSSFHSLASDRNINPPTREVETERRLANAADTNIAVSELVREDIRELYGADSRVVYNGFSTPTFSGKDVREDLGIDGEMVFFVGRHTDQKGSRTCCTRCASSAVPA